MHAEVLISAFGVKQTHRWSLRATALHLAPVHRQMARKAGLTSANIFIAGMQ